MTSPIEDDATHALALTHHIQNRILQVVRRGECSANIANEVKTMADDISYRFARMALLGEDDQ